MSEHIKTVDGQQVFPSRRDHSKHNTGISADDVLRNPEQALKKNNNITNGAIESHNQTVREYNDLNDSFTAKANIETIMKLSKQADADLKNIKSVSDYRVAFSKWKNELAQYSVDPNTGKLSPEVGAYINTVARVIDQKGVTISRSELAKEGLGILQQSSTDMSLKIGQGDLAGANTHYRQTLNALNQMEANGTLGKGLSKALRITYKRRFNDETMGAIQNSTLTMLNLSGYDNANKYLKKVDRMLDTSKGSLPKQEAYSQFLKMFKKMPNEAVIKTYNKSLENYIKIGVGNPIHLMGEADSKIKYLEGLKKRGQSNTGITSMQNDIKAFRYLFTAFGDVYNKGESSKFKALMTGVNSKNINKLIASLGIKDPEVVQKVARQHSLFMKRFINESRGDPVKLATALDASFKKAIGKEKVEEPETIVDMIKEEKRVSQKYYGKDDMSTETQNRAINEVINGDPSEGALEGKQDIINALGDNPAAQAAMLAARNGDFDVDMRTLASKFPTELANLSPTTENTRRVRSLFKRRGFRTVHQNVQTVLYDHKDILEETANIIGTTRSALAYNIALDVSVGSTSNIAGGLTLDQLERSPENEGVKDRLNSILIGKLQRMQAGFKTYNGGDFSIKSDSSLAKGIDEWKREGFSSVGTRLRNEEEFNAAKSILDLFNTDESVVDNKAKDAKLKFYKKLSDISGLPTTSFRNRLHLKQNARGGDYYLVFKDTDDIGYINVQSIIPQGIKNKYRISEESMEQALKSEDKKAVGIFLIGAIINDSP